MATIDAGILEVQVNTWIKCVKTINLNLNRLETNELDAYQTILKTMEKKRANVKVIETQSEILLRVVIKVLTNLK